MNKQKGKKLNFRKFGGWSVIIGIFLLFISYFITFGIYLLTLGILLVFAGLFAAFIGPDHPEEKEKEYIKTIKKFSIMYMCTLFLFIVVAFLVLKNSRNTVLLFVFLAIMMVLLGMLEAKWLYEES